LVKESFEEEMSSDEETELSEQPIGDDEDSDEENDLASAEDDNADADIEDSEEEEMSDDEETDEDGGFATELTPMDDEDSEDFEDDVDADEVDTIDMTGASDDEVLRIFKKMGEDDGIIVKKEDNGDVELTVNDEEFLVKLNEEDELDMEDEEMEDEISEEDEFETEVDEQEAEMTDEDETLYEIVFDDEDEFGLDSLDMGSEESIGGDDEDMFDMESDNDLMIDDEENDINSIEDEFSIDIDSENSEFADEAEFMEIARTIGMGNRPNALKKGARSGAILNKEHVELKKQNKLLKEKVEEYKKALGLFRDKLNEVAVFNANLAYATRLFTEHSTTKQEKMTILKRFDDTSTLKESQSLYKTIKSELNSKATITENVATKIVKTPSNGSSANSKEILAESKAYTSPQFARMKDLFNKLK
jgi:hypothetical protein